MATASSAAPSRRRFRRQTRQRPSDGGVTGIWIRPFDRGRSVPGSGPLGFGPKGQNSSNVFSMKNTILRGPVFAPPPSKKPGQAGRSLLTEGSRGRARARFRLRFRRCGPKKNAPGPKARSAGRETGCLRVRGRRLPRRPVSGFSATSPPWARRRRTWFLGVRCRIRPYRYGFFPGRPAHRPPFSPGAGSLGG